MAATTDVLVSPEEYLERERAADLERSEYRDGAAVQVSGAGFQHAVVAGNIVRALGNRLLHANCVVVSFGLRVDIRDAGLIAYPDVVVICGEPQFADAHQDTLLNPTLLLEVLSPSTQDYDRGGGRRSCPWRKFARYRTLDSLRDYVLVAQDAAHIEHYARQGEGRWLLSEVRGRSEAIELSSIECQLALSDVYRNVEHDSHD